MEEGSGDGDRGWYANLGSLPELALVACVSVPLDILLERRPPEAIEEGAARRIKPFVAEVVVSVADQWESLVRGNVELMLPIALSSPELVVEEEEPGCCPKELRCCLAVQIRRESLSPQVMSHARQVFLRLACLVRDWEFHWILRCQGVV